jgi:large subunit ribosomal protein L24
MAQLQSKLKRGDEVIVIAGKEKGKSGKITRVLTAANRVYIEGVNLVKKHVSQRAALRLNREPGVMQKEASINVTNVMLKDPKTGKPTRVGYRIEADGSKVRVAKASGTVIDTVKKAKSGSAAKAKTATKTKSK